MEPLQRVTAPTVDVLSILLESAGPVFGLEIMKRSGRPSGTVYPILERLERQGWISSEWEEHTDTQLRRRRVYTFTPEGAVAAREVVARAQGAS
ncbi:PadR family transcriptional regulator [Herbiconiux sp. CPCC 203407]|uniref:PadR family transcriptional regulator n=1 Tax=Herbiconiux oxytropis TaxID=2970915 RepID=A0AA41XFS5_9MICO|nr:PadR family transcriptional regulator [Herbiconiux oxytropis]MCS5722687.1 PadR family transcriptional regulator [Herbiconiux oxytropis]MCS5725384.1 PadR family transcriptional regulator [Herbiconiux oxytropis]